MAEIGTLFALAKSIEVSDAKFECVQDSGEVANVLITEGGSKAVQSQDSAVELKTVGNLTFGEKAQLPHGSNSLVIRWSGKILSLRDIPSVADDYHLGKESKVPTTSYIDLMKEFKASESLNNDFDIVAEAILFNILNASWAFRNRDVSESIETVVAFRSSTQTISIKIANSLVAKKTPFSDITNGIQVDNTFADAPGYQDVVAMIVATLRGNDELLAFDVKSTLLMSDGSVVYPSQLFLPDSKKKFYVAGGKKVNYSKELYRSVVFGDEDVAGITAEKIWNAIRTIDCFHKNEFSITSPVEPNGANSQFNIKLRGARNDFYAYKNEWLKNGLEGLIEKTNKSPGDMIFFITSLIRGGVLGNAK